MTTPNYCFHFASVAERWVGGPVADRLYCLDRVADDAIVQLQAAYNILSRPDEQIWIPGHYRNEEQRRRVESVTDAIIEGATPTAIAIRSGDMLSVSETWMLVAAPPLLWRPSS